MSHDAIPPDVRAVRKARFNSDIIKLCSVPHVAHSRPIAQGIGLYTHVAGPKTVKLNPHFDFVDNTDREVALLPLGGPRRIQPNKNREPLDEEVAALYNEVANAVKDEEKIWNDQRAAAAARGEPPRDAYRVTLDTLKKKYGDDDAPPPAYAELQQHYNNQDARRHSEVAGSTSGGPSKERRVSFPASPELRRRSTGNAAVPGSDANKEQQRRRSSNTYDVNRDPRLRRR